MGLFSNRRHNEEIPESDSTSTMADRQALPPQPIGFETVLGANGVLEGTLTSGGNVRLDGTFTGTLDISGNILVGETAKITANIDARNISIAGAVRGNVTGNKVQILRTGRVWGDIVAKALTMEEGAFIDGKISMTGHVANKPAESVLDETIDTEEEHITEAMAETISSDEQTEDDETVTHTDDALVADNDATESNTPLA